MEQLFLGSIGMPEILVLALIILLVFGGKKIPELMKGLGKGVRSFKDGMKGLDDESGNAGNQRAIVKKRGTGAEKGEPAARSENPSGADGNTTSGASERER